MSISPMKLVSGLSKEAMQELHALGVEPEAITRVSVENHVNELKGKEEHLSAKSIQVMHVKAFSKAVVATAAKLTDDSTRRLLFLGKSHLDVFNEYKGCASVEVELSQKIAEIGTENQALIEMFVSLPQYAIKEPLFMSLDEDQQKALEPFFNYCATTLVARKKINDGADSKKAAEAILTAFAGNPGLLAGVTKLNFKQSSLNRVPGHLAKYFPNLKELSLESNHLKTLPVELGKLTKLRRLELGYNSFDVMPPVVKALQKTNPGIEISIENHTTKPDLRSEL